LHKQKVAQNVTISLGYFTFSKNHNEPRKEAQLVKNRPIWSPWFVISDEERKLSNVETCSSLWPTLFDVNESSVLAAPFKSSRSMVAPSETNMFLMIWSRFHKTFLRRNSGKGCFQAKSKFITDSWFPKHMNITILK